MSVVLVHPEPPSLLGGFDGVMSMDVSSNLHLDLTLFNVTGTVFGRVPAGNGSQFTFQGRHKYMSVRFSKFYHECINL